MWIITNITILLTINWMRCCFCNNVKYPLYWVDTMASGILSLPNSHTSPFTIWVAEKHKQIRNIVWDPIALSLNDSNVMSIGQILSFETAALLYKDLFAVIDFQWISLLVKLIRTVVCRIIKAFFILYRVICYTYNKLVLYGQVKVMSNVFQCSFKLCGFR